MNDQEGEEGEGGGTARAAGTPAAAPPASGGHRPGWRTVPPRQGTAAAGPAAGAAPWSQPPQDAALPELVSEDDGSEWETDSGGSEAETEDGQVDDYAPSEDEDDEEGRSLPGSHDAADSDDGMPPLEVASSEEDEGRWAATGAGGRPGSRAAPRPLLPHADMLLLAAVALGELTRRFLLLLGAPPPPAAASAAAPASPFAAAWAGAERLRALSSVPTAPGRERDELTVRCCPAAEGNPASAMSGGDSQLPLAPSAAPANA